MTALSSTNPCARSVPEEAASIVPSNHPKPHSAETIIGSRKSAEKRVLSSSTGSTAFPVRDCFLAAS